MLTYTGLRNLFGSLTSNTAAANLTLADTLINEKTRELIHAKPWDFRETTSTASTIASQQFYPIPVNCGKYKGVTVTIGTTKYTPKEIKSREQWDRLNQSTSLSNTPEYYYVFNNQVGFYPTPSSATASAITHIYQKKHIDLSIADVTSPGSIYSVSTTAGVSTVTGGSGTAWTSSLVGRFLRIDAPNGDGDWYEIVSVPTSTTLTLTRPYGAADFTSSVFTYLIGQCSILPEASQIVPLYGALELYFTSVQPEPERAKLYGAFFREGKGNLSSTDGNKTANITL